MSLILVIIRWAVGVFFALTFLVYFTTSPVSAIGSLLLAVMLIPPLAHYVFAKIPYTFSRKALLLFGVVLFFVVMFSVPSTSVKGEHTLVTPTPTQTIQVTHTVSPTATSTPTPTPKPLLSPVYTPTPTSYMYVAPTSAPDNGLSNDSYYTNSSGNEVHSPAYSDNGSVPAGATARCGDGTYSFSQHRSGTCSHHGGVAEWL